MIIRKIKELMYKSELKKINRNQSILQRSADEIGLNLNIFTKNMDKALKNGLKSSRLQALSNNIKHRLDKAQAAKNSVLEAQLLDEQLYILKNYA
jgi:hypothetical protein